MATENKDDIIIAMLEEMKSNIKNRKDQQTDFAKVESLTKQLESSIDSASSCAARMEGIMEEVRKPVISQRKITINIVAKEVVFLFIAMGFVISVMGAALYFVSRPNYDRNDNDLKYRYIKMKGEATPDRISELENIFAVKRDNTKIRRMGKDVKSYERAVKEKAALDEQNRLRQFEVEKLNKEVEKIKEK